MVFDRELSRSTVLVPGTALLSGPLDMGMSMGMHDVIWSEEAGQDATDSRVGKDLIQPGNFLKDMVARIALSLEYGFGFPADFFVDGGQVSMDADIPISDEIPYFFIVEEIRLINHNESFRSFNFSVPQSDPVHPAVYCRIAAKRYR
jgi:hypothetical protein